MAGPGSSVLGEGEECEEGLWQEESSTGGLGVHAIVFEKVVKSRGVRSVD